jgi:hypothetical protein
LQIKNAAKPGMLADGNGLYLQTSLGPNNSIRKSWIFRFERDGKERQMGLGSLSHVPIQEARKKAHECRQSLQNGIDPIEQKRLDKVKDQIAASKTMSFDQCRDAFIAAHRAGWRNIKHANQWTDTLKTYVSPVFGNLPPWRYPLTAAQSRTLSIRPRTLLAVSGFVFQIGSRAFMIRPTSIEDTG